MWSFVDISQTVSELWSGHKYMVEMAMFNVQKVMTPKVCKPELRFMCSAHCLSALNLFEVLWKYLKWYQSYGVDKIIMKCWQMDGRTLKISDSMI